MDTHSLTRLIGKFSFLIPLLFLTVLPSCLPLLTGAGLMATGGGGDDGGGGSGTPALPSPSVVYMWASSTRSNGNIGGINGADTICETNAGISFPTTVSTHRAVLRSSTNDPRNYFANDPPLERRDGATIASTYSAFFVRNQAVTASVWTNNTSYWSGIDLNGAPDTNNCSDWTDNTTGTALEGQANQTDNRRYTGAASNCATTAGRLLCISY